MVANETQQPPNCEKSADEGDNKADHEHTDIIKVQDFMMLIDIVKCGGEHDRDRQEEREFGRGLA